MYYVYIIYSRKLNKKYIGYCNDLKRRFIIHNQGKVSFTSKGIPWILVYYECFVNNKDARREEIFLKSGRGRERLKFLLNETMKN